jgi:hypothetical protein
MPCVDSHPSAQRRARDSNPQPLAGHLISKPAKLSSKYKSNKALTTTNPAYCTTGRTSQEGEEGIRDEDLETLIRAWPTLPLSIKVAIKALIDAAGGSS